jgi:hypothetical protein
MVCLVLPPLIKTKMKPPRILLSAAVTFGLGLLSGCGGGSANPPATAATAPDVYVAGVVYNNQNNNNSIATYWKNGVAVSLGGFTLGSSASSIAVSGSDIYVAGVGSNGGQDIATYWKNGVSVPLTDGTYRGYVNSIAVSNGDVYVAGAEMGPNDSLAVKYWKNGAPVILTNGAINAMANAIFVSGTDIYVAGSVNQTTRTSPNSTYNGPVATLWKNGVAVSLTDGLHSSTAYSVFVSGADVYVAGYAAQTQEGNDFEATYWKNGVPVTLAGQIPSSVSSIFVTGQDVFAAGDTSSSPAYWQNGTQFPLIGSDATQIVVSNGNVYVSGVNFPTSPIYGSLRGRVTSFSYLGATYWENANPNPLAPNADSSYANAIAVVAPQSK